MRLIVAAATLALAGCAATGVQVSDDQAARFVKGETTKDQVVAALGRPTTQVRNANGSSVLMYTHSEVRTHAATFIPIVGLFAGGADSRLTNVILNFDADGKFVDYSSSQSEYGTGMGAKAGQIDPVPDQPRKP